MTTEADRELANSVLAIINEGANKENKLRAILNHCRGITGSLAEELLETAGNTYPNLNTVILDIRRYCMEQLQS